MYHVYINMALSVSDGKRGHMHVVQKLTTKKTTPKQVRFQAPLPRYMYICRLEWLTYIEIGKLKISNMYMQVQMPKYDEVYRKSNKKMINTQIMIEYEFHQTCTKTYQFTLLNLD